MDPKADVVTMLVEEATSPGSVLNEMGRPFDGIAVVITRDEPGSTLVDDIARYAAYLDSVTDTHLLILLPWTPPPSVQVPPASADVGTLFSSPVEFAERREAFFNLATSKEEDRRVELQVQLASNANRVRDDLGFSDDAMPGILMFCLQERRIILVRLGGFLPVTGLFGELRRSYSNDPSADLSRRIVEIAKDANLSPAKLGRLKPDVFEKWEHEQWDWSNRSKPSSKPRLG